MKNNLIVENTTLRPIFFVEVHFKSEVMRLNSIDRNITTLGQTWLGAGSVGNISEIGVTSGTQAVTLKLTLGFIPSSSGADIINENIRNSPVSIYIGFLNEENLLIEDPALWFKGYVDTIGITAGAMITSSISVTSKLINWAKSINSRYTHEDQLSKHPNDKGFQFISEIPTLKLKWGS